jgi:hypothetical protein
VVAHLLISEHTLRVAFGGRGTFLRQGRATLGISRGVFVEGGEDGVTVGGTTFGRLLGTGGFFAALFEEGGVLLGQVSEDFLAVETGRTEVRNVEGVATPEVDWVILVGVEVVLGSAVGGQRGGTFTWLQSAAQVVVRVVYIQHHLMGTTGSRVSRATVLMHFVFLVHELFVLATLAGILPTTHVQNGTACIFKHTVHTTSGRVFGAAASVLLVVGPVLFSIHTVLFANVTLGEVLVFLLFAAVGLLRVVFIIEDLGSADFRDFVAVLLEGGGSGERGTTLGVLGSLLLLDSEA